MEWHYKDSVIGLVRHAVLLRQALRGCLALDARVWGPGIQPRAERDRLYHGAWDIAFLKKSQTILRY